MIDALGKKSPLANRNFIQRVEENNHNRSLIEILMNFILLEIELSKWIKNFF